MRDWLICNIKHLLLLSLQNDYHFKVTKIVINIVKAHVRMFYKLRKKVWVKYKMNIFIIIWKL